MTENNTALNVGGPEARYWQHRISHMWDASKRLFDMGYLTIGWQGLADSNILEESMNHGEAGFNQASKDNGLTTRNRWNLYRFFSMKPGDVVVVPLYERAFAVVEISGYARPVKDLPTEGFTSINDRYIEKTDCLKYAGSTEVIDLGFFIPFNSTAAKIIPRGYATSALQSRMKHRLTNADISDLARDVRAAAVATGPADLHGIIGKATADAVLTSINDNVTSDSLEHLIKWYMEKSGASRVYIPAKNERGKEGGADADVIAEFDALGVVYFIQAKKHSGQTDDWAIHQIKSYKAQKENTEDDYTYIPWVISTAAFKDNVYEIAHDAGVRLIDGLAFSKMLLDAGIDSINDTMQYLKGNRHGE